MGSPNPTLLLCQLYKRKTSQKRNCDATREKHETIRKLYECNKCPTVLKWLKKKNIFRKEEKNREGATPLEPAPAKVENGLRPNGGKVG